MNEVQKPARSPAQARASRRPPPTFPRSRRRSLKFAKKFSKPQLSTSLKPCASRLIGTRCRPLFERGAKHPAGTDPIEVLKALSFDGKGREILALANAVLSQPYVRIKRGPFESYEWPAYARTLSPPGTDREWRALWACVRFADLGRSNAEGRPHVMRLGIGADGVWHYFWNEE